MRKRFRFRAIPFIAMLLMVALGIALGNWQERRAVQKTALQAKLAAGNAAAPLPLGAQPLDPQAVEFRRVSVTGQFVPQWALYLDNRPYNGQAGFYLLMPLRIAGSQMHVLVARGWLPRNLAQRDKLPPVATPAGTVTIEGIARLGAGRVMQLGGAPRLAPGAIVQNAEVADVAAASGLALQPFVIEQTTPDMPRATAATAATTAAATAAPAATAAVGEVGAAAAGPAIVRDWPAPALGVERHQGYAFQWYALALMAFIFFVATGFRRGKNDN